MFPALPAPAPPVARPRPTPTRLVVLVALIWCVPVAALCTLGFLVLVVALWGAASGESPVAFLLGAAGAAAAGAAVLAALYRAPFLRGMTPTGRIALLGVVVWPFPVVALAYALNG
ncbi:hypothetical protein [Kitasatospora cinereorecta]|uniref:hypothetical protein n=1 Tax=unclassified Streptomyces TaxID=2593676 RepID=UPI003382E277